MHPQQLAIYTGVGDALVLILAQLAAFAAQTAALLREQEASRYVAPGLWPPAACWAWARAARARWAPGSGGRAHTAASSSGSNSRDGSSHARRQSQPPQQAAAAAPGGTPAWQPVGAALAPAAAAAPAGAAAGADCDAVSVGISTLLSALERQGSLASTRVTLWEPRMGAARQLLRREMDAGIGHYVSLAALAVCRLPLLLGQLLGAVTGPWHHTLTARCCVALCVVCARLCASCVHSRAVVVRAQRQQGPASQGASVARGALPPAAAAARAWPWSWRAARRPRPQRRRGRDAR
jgi:hypothetical protein